MEGLYMQCIWKYIQQCLTLGYQVCGYFLVDLYFSHSYKENTLLSESENKDIFYSDGSIAATTSSSLFQDPFQN